MKILIAATFLMLTGCAGPQSDEDYDRRARFAQAFQNYAASRQADYALQAAQTQATIDANRPRKVIICNLPANSAYPSC